MYVCMCAYVCVCVHVGASMHVGEIASSDAQTKHCSYMQAKHLGDVSCVTLRDCLLQQL